MEKALEDKKEKRKERVKEARAAKKAGINIADLAKTAADRSEEFNVLQEAAKVETSPCTE